MALTAENPKKPGSAEVVGGSAAASGEKIGGGSLLRWFRTPWPRPAAAITAIAVLAVFFFLLFPGAYTPDSTIMLSQADNSTVDTNWHPPVAIAVWGALLLVVQSANGLWIAQTLGLGLAVYSVARSVVSKVSMVLLAIIVVATPPMLQLVAPLWKDSQLAIVYLAALGLSTRPPQSWPKQVALGLVALAIVVLRFNAFPLAVLPLWRLFQSLPIAEWRLPLAQLVGKRPVLPALGLTLAVTAGISFTGSQIVDRQLAPQNPTQVWDMVGIQAHGGDVELSARMQRQPPCSQQEILAAYNPGSVGDLTYGAESCFAIIWPDDYQRQSLVAEENNIVSTGDWLDAIVENPGPYARHRLAATRRLLAYESAPMRGSSLSDTALEARVSTIDARPQQYRTLEYLRTISISRAFTFRPYVWLLTIIAASAALLFGGVERRWLAMVLVPLAATYGITIMLSPVATMRYSFPLLIGAIFLVVQACDHFLRTAQDAETPLDPSIVDG